jgi:SAM-dependent methyltransferase
MIQKSQVDFGKTAHDYASHRAGFPDSFFRKLEELGLFSGKPSVLDLGTGTGTVARGFALRGCDVTGLDPSESMIGQARILDQKENVRIKYVPGTAEKTGLPDQDFDIITAGQCFHWFDGPQALREIKRLLRPNGLLVIAYFDWISRPGNPVDEMYKLQKKYNPSWKNQWPLGYYPQKPGEQTFEGLISRASFLYEEGVAYTHAGWRGRMRAYAGIGGSLPRPLVEQFDAEFAGVLGDKFKEDLMLIPHKVWAGIWQLQS